MMGCAVNHTSLQDHWLQGEWQAAPVKQNDDCMAHVGGEGFANVLKSWGTHSRKNSTKFQEECLPRTHLSDLPPGPNEVTILHPGT